MPAPGSFPCFPNNAGVLLGGTREPRTSFYNKKKEIYIIIKEYTDFPGALVTVSNSNPGKMSLARKISSRYKQIFTEVTNESGPI